MQEIGVGIIGFGTVGAGTYEVLTENSAIIQSRVGVPVRVKKIADLDLETDRGVQVNPEILTTEAMEVIQDPEIHVVVELIGGVTQAKEYILAAMENGKHVVTANKALLAEHGKEIYTKASRCGVEIGFEASVAGGIPILQTLRSGLCANRIKTLMGILNGTSNYILTKMSKEGLPYSRVVQEAVEQGYAEDPPTLDVDGTDAAHKLAVLISLIYGKAVSFKDIYREGIQEITPDDVQFARELGYCIKLLAVCRDLNGQVEARVHPALVPMDHILANVNDVFNAIYVEGDFVGPNLYYGLGAGRRPTGSAVAADIMALARRIASGTKAATPPLGHVSPSDGEVPLLPMDDLVCEYYFRFSALDKPGVLSRIAGVLGEHDISIAWVIQKGREINGSVPVVMMTHEARESNVRKAVSLLDSLEELSGKTMVIRVEK